MREAKFGRSSKAVSNDNQPDGDRPARKPAGKKRPPAKKG